MGDAGDGAPSINGAADVDGRGRLDSPAFVRNIGPIREALSPLIGGVRGRALELGCGPGRHAVALAEAFPDIEWTPSDPFRHHRVSAAAWGGDAGLANLCSPLALDAANDWATEVSDIAPFVLVYAINVVHIAPWSVTKGIVVGAAKSLTPGGWLALYGPFTESGRPTGKGNLDFDAHLRARDSRWGVRALEDVDRLARAAELGEARIARLPSDNILACWRAAA